MYVIQPIFITWQYQDSMELHHDLDNESQKQDITWQYQDSMELHHDLDNESQEQDI